MNTLGLSFDFHDASAALLRDGEVLGTSAEERFTLHKHDPSFPAHAAASVLAQAGQAVDGLDAVVFYEQPNEKFTRVLHSGFDRFPRGSRAFARSMRKWLGTTLWTRNLIASALHVHPSKVVCVPHHDSHVAQAFVQSPFDSAAVLVADGVGEWACTSLATASRAQGLRVLESHEYPHSIGLVYAAFTAFLGFRPNSGEASTMALAAFGQPRYRDEVAQVLRALPDGGYRVAPGLLDFLAEGERLFKPAFRRLFGEPRPFRAPYPFDALKEVQEGVGELDQRHADIAASLQQALSEILLGLCARLHRLTGERHLCLSGGVALNCLANTDIIRSAGFEQVFIPSDPGDGGASVGAAAVVCGMGRPQPRASAYLGPDCEADGLSALLDPSYLHALARENRAEGLPAVAEISVQRLDDDPLVELVAARLSAGAVIGWVQGRLEAGPRALGNRSLLVDPSRLDAVRRLSATVKRHQPFRPYALSIAGEAATRVLDCACPDEPALRWMQTVWPVRPEWRARLRAGIHVDGTTRPQLVWREDNPRFWMLLQAFSAHSGLPALLNTSFNERSMPMAGTALVALMTFLRTGMDALVVGNLVVRKTWSR